MQRYVFAAALGGLVLAAGTAQAATKPGDKVEFSGCTTAGTNASCVMIKGADGADYNVTGARPKLRPGVGVSGRGVVSDDVSICGQGVVLKTISYQRTRLACARPSPPAKAGR